MNTVHVSDAVRALWHLRQAGKAADVFNLADKGDTSELGGRHKREGLDCVGENRESGEEDTRDTCV